ncbi:MAG: hypothetical protein ABIJ42_10645, partial [Acidobacteriota bacterium]
MPKHSKLTLTAGLICAFILVFAGMGSAAAPNWTPITGNQYTMIAYGDVFVNTVKISSSGYILGAFGPGGESDNRAVTNVATNGSYFLTIRGNVLTGETITFKLYEPNLDSILNVSETIPFVSDGSVPQNLNAAILPGTISGQVSYSGTASGKYYVGAWDAALGQNFGDSAPLKIADAGTSGSYTMQLPPGNYIVAAYRDSDNGGSTSVVDLDNGEPAGFYTATAGPAGQNGAPTGVSLASGESKTVNFAIYDWPYFIAVDLIRDTFPATGPANLPKGEVLWAEVTTGYRPGVNQITSLTVSGPGIASPAALLDTGVFPDEVAGDGKFTGWVNTGGTVNAGPYTFTVTANSLIEGQDASIQGAALALPTVVSPGAYVTAPQPTTFQWNEVASATSYKLLILNKSNPTAIADFLLRKGGIAGTQYELLTADLTLVNGQT